MARTFLLFLKKKPLHAQSVQASTPSTTFVQTEVSVLAQPQRVRARPLRLSSCLLQLRVRQAPLFARGVRLFLLFCGSPLRAVSPQIRSEKRARAEPSAGHLEAPNHSRLTGGRPVGHSMSKLILDFDLSSQRRRANTTASARKTVRSAEPKPAKEEVPNAAKSVPEKPPPSPEETFGGLAQLRKHFKLTLGVLSCVVVSCFFFFLFLESGTYGTTASRDFLVRSSCTTQNAYVLCHAESCNLKGACHGTAKNVVFSSAQCADAVRTVAVHQDDGAVKHYPAYYLRVYNTTSFAVDGKRALFFPVPSSCHASSRPRASQVESALSNRLRGSVVWVASEKFKRYSLYSGEHLVANMEEDTVLVEQVGPSHFVYEFRLACDHWGPRGQLLSVFGEAGQKRKEVEAFDYCG